jgi:hypothetical protein
LAVGRYVVGWSKRISLRLVETHPWQDPFAPTELPGFNATMDPSDSRRDRTAVMFSRHSLTDGPPGPSAAPLGLPGSWLICRHPPSPITPESPIAALARCFTTGMGFRTFGRLATLNGVTRPKRVHACALRLTPSLRGASPGRIAPPDARAATWRTSTYHVQYLSTEKISQTSPGAPKSRKTENTKQRNGD